MNSLAWLKRLVAFDTTSRNSNLELMAALQEWFSSHHVTSRLIHDANEPKANLFATLPAHDGSIHGGIVLSGHTDVVPVDGQTWDTDPFCVTQKNDLLYGRGTSDMKGFIAVVLSLLPEFKSLKLNKPIHFAFSYDEEIGCKGAISLVNDIRQQGIQPEGCIVGEPTEMKLVVGHKGIHLFRCRIQGRAAHSSLTPQGCNAIEYAAQLICRIREFADQTKQYGPYDECYDVPFSSFSTNMIQGGNAFNTIPASCEFYFEFRNLPSDHPDQILKQIKSYVDDNLLPRMRVEYPEASVEIHSLAAVPGLEASPTASITKLIQDLTQQKNILKVAYATEAGLFQQADIPTVICGPGSIEQAHRANEYISLKQLNECEVFLREFGKVMSSGQ
jgi:acetylornithine deacetylase